ncbi:MAG: B12-binding domain-containing radical SAM protein, partial [Candidatus Limnocylindria bacterium]
RYPVRFACEATLNIAKNDRVLELMREAGFITVFCGIETPEPAALRFMSKDQNLRMPILESVGKLNSYGLEVVSGIIIGLDTDTPQTADHIIEFVRASHIPVLTINLLYALPKTPLWRRLQAAGRLLADGDRESNVVFTLPYETVLETWLRCIKTAYEPGAVYARFAHNVAHTFPNRIAYPPSPHRGSWRNVLMGVGVLGRVIWRVGVRGDYRKTFWRFAGPALRRGDIEHVIQTAVVSHHLIAFTRQCLDGAREPSFYAPVTAPPRAAVAG